MPADRLPDDMLLAGLGVSDPDASLVFVRRFQAKVFGVALTILGDISLAEDVAQQTFERAHKHALMYDAQRGSVKNWLTTIAHNLAIDMARLRSATPVDPDELIAQLGIRYSEDRGPEHHAVNEDASVQLRKAIAELPGEQARVLVLAGIYGMTAAEISSNEGIPLGTAKTRIRSAMRKVREILTLAQEKSPARETSSNK